MRLCEFPSCSGPHYARGYCNSHYQQLKRTGELVTLRKYKSERGYSLESLLSWTTPNGECLIWSRADNKQGYGIAQHNGKQWMAHRLAFHIATGIEIGRQVIHHTCANGMCINPKHLQLAHQADNNLEMLARKSYEAKIAALEAKVKTLECELAEAQAVIR